MLVQTHGRRRNGQVEVASCGGKDALDTAGVSDHIIMCVNECFQTLDSNAISSVLENRNKKHTVGGATATHFSSSMLKKSEET